MKRKQMENDSNLVNDLKRRDALMTANENGSTDCPRIAVVGVGGAGCNVISSFSGRECQVDTIAINTDRKALEKTEADKKIYICKEVLKGEGTRGDANLGKKCAECHIEEIRDALFGYEYVFVVAGLGGGTGSGAMPIVIDSAAIGGAETSAIAIKPFFFEGERKELAAKAYRRVQAVCRNSCLVDNNLIMSLEEDCDLNTAFSKVNEGIVDHIAEFAKSVEINSPRKKRISDIKPSRTERTGIIPLGLLVCA